MMKEKNISDGVHSMTNGLIITPLESRGTSNKQE